ncbi:multiubiquitin domain-containing protein [Bradyrhizobium macuxiense]|uniref:multiubiquitin domain-containing protein n=1 Tax=Bradyrhizobium macuxiense TaxID=1755647 RepID=UPI000B224874|nr:multiubiquitin domain-containing protein [Bradyrhizobium macuxiense]
MSNEKDNPGPGPEGPGGAPGGQGGGGNPGHGGNGGNPGHGGGEGHGGHGEKVTVLVNEKRVVFDEERQTGMSIKQTAIAQGVAIELDFVLSIERGGGKTELIGDDDDVKLHDGDRFLAIPNDDNS